MRRIDLNILGSQLEQTLLAVEAGETVLVTEHGEVVAELRPPSVDPVQAWNDRRIKMGAPPLTAFEEKGVREGWLEPASEFGPLPSSSMAPEVTIEELLEELAHDREDR